MRACQICGIELIRRETGESNPKFMRRKTCSKTCAAKLYHKELTQRRKSPSPAIHVVPKSRQDTAKFHNCIDKFLYWRVACSHR